MSDYEAAARPFGLPSDVGVHSAGAAIEQLRAAVMQLQRDLAAANADAERLAVALAIPPISGGPLNGLRRNLMFESCRNEALAAHRARVGEKPLRCDNCGKTMAEHGPLANCRARVGGDQ